MRPLVFVAMPFGKKEDPGGTIEIDFDQIYAEAIAPATTDAQVDVIRADEELMGGFIHAPMYERLILAEIVIADLTTANPNVFYELGIRHAARPRSTIMIFNAGGILPFDVRPLRAIPYHLDSNGQLTPDKTEELRRALKGKLIEAVEGEDNDSPLFQLIPGFPGIKLQPDVTAAFRDRARHIEATRLHIEHARTLGNQQEALAELVAIERSLRPFTAAAPELLVSLLLAFRDLGAWESMIQLVRQFSQVIQEHRTVQELYAFALNRRNGDGDRQEAVRVLQGVIQTNGPHPETCGLLGRVYKDRYLEAKAAGQMLRASGHLDEAIHQYRVGFKSDPRDYYPGINAVILLLVKGDVAAMEELLELTQVVKFAVARRGGLTSSDHWDVATLLHIAVLQQDWALATRATARLIAMVQHAWIMDTTLRDLITIKEAMDRQHWGTDPLSSLIEELRHARDLL